MRLLALTLALATLIPACSTKSPGSSLASRSGGGDGNTAGTSGINVGNGGSGAGINVGDGGPPPVAGGVITADGGPSITVSGAQKDVQLTATADGSPISGTWTTSDTTIGSVGSDGVFHANGYVGGTVDVMLLVGNAQIKITLTVDVDITENPAMLATADQTALMAGGAADPNFKFLYPFDGTVFPRGLPAPSLQFGDGKSVTTNASANGIYIKITTSHFSYQQFGLGGTPIRGVIPDAVWKGATLSAGANDQVTVAVNKRTGSTVTGPVTENWRIAQGTLKGFIYYSTYKSPLLPLDQSTGIGGGILRIKPGDAMPEIVRKGCVVCHSISASGSVLSAASGPDLMNPTTSDAVNLSPASATPTARSPVSNIGQQFSFAALTPDGSLALTNGNVSGVPPVVPHGLLGDYQSILVNTSTGAPLASPSLTQLVKHAQSPAFSPDGKHVAFFNGDVTPARELSIMDFDGTSVFSNLKILRNETDTTTNSAAAQGGSQPPPGPPLPKTDAWPSFTPDSAAVVYHSGDSFDSSGFNYNGTGTSYAQYAELHLVELDGTVKKLNSLNGRDASGTSVLPYGEAIDNNENYEPNVMPLPVGGYIWVVFTSRRSYGNTWAPGRAKKGDDQYDDPTQDPWGSNAGPSPRKKLWVAAIDLNHADATNLDPSHAAFYLPGQEDESANMRAFAALAPCQMDNTTCESGSDCCGGYCRQTGNDPTTGAPVLQCVPPPTNTCSNVDEPCMTALDCCDPSDLCIGGRCEQPPPVK